MCFVVPFVTIVILMWFFSLWLSVYSCNFFCELLDALQLLCQPLCLLVLFLSSAQNSVTLLDYMNVNSSYLLCYLITGWWWLPTNIVIAGVFVFLCLYNAMLLSILCFTFITSRVGQIFSVFSAFIHLILPWRTWAVLV